MREIKSKLVKSCGFTMAVDVFLYSFENRSSIFDRKNNLVNCLKNIERNVTAITPQNNESFINVSTGGAKCPS